MIQIWRAIYLKAIIIQMSFAQHGWGHSYAHYLALETPITLLLVLVVYSHHENKKLVRDYCT